MVNTEKLKGCAEGNTPMNLRARSQSRTRSIAFVGLTIALMTVSGWVSIPFGPVPFTLQTFVIMFALLALGPRESLAAVTGYLALGAVGLPVFASMTGGVGILAGPTGGFLWGFLLGAAVALVFLQAARPLAARNRTPDGETMRERAFDGEAVSASESRGRPSRFREVRVRGLAVEFAAGLLFVAVSYLCGWAQLMAVAHMDPLAAFAVGIAPFIIIDAVKLVAAVLTAHTVKRAL